MCENSLTSYWCSLQWICFVFLFFSLCSLTIHLVHYLTLAALLLLKLDANSRRFLFWKCWTRYAAFIWVHLGHSSSSVWPFTVSIVHWNSSIEDGKGTGSDLANKQQSFLLTSHNALMHRPWRFNGKNGSVLNYVSARKRWRGWRICIQHVTIV